jgi:hypothetical protein
MGDFEFDIDLLRVTKETVTSQSDLILQGAAERSPLFGKLIISKPKKIR